MWLGNSGYEGNAMTKEESKSNGPIPAPMISRRGDRSPSLNLDEVDMSKDGVQGNVEVSKRRASTLVSVVPADGERD